MGWGVLNTNHKLVGTQEDQRRRKRKKGKKMAESVAVLLITIFTISTFTVVSAVEDKCAACYAVAVFLILISSSVSHFYSEIASHTSSDHNFRSFISMISVFFYHSERLCLIN